MFTMFAGILYLQCILLPYCSCQLGLFFDEDVNGNLKGTSLPDNVEASRDIFVGDFLYFKEKFNTIKVYRSGVIAIGEEAEYPACPPINILASARKYIAPYWLPTTSGDVTYNIKINSVENDANDDADFAKMTIDINAAFREAPISTDNIHRAVIVTWNQMQNINNQPRTQTNDNSFQVVLVIMNDGKTYVIFVYRVLTYQFIYNLLENAQAGAKCKNRAVIAFGNGNQHYNFPISLAFFPFRRMRVATHSNIYNYKLLGRYAFDLSIFARDQKIPPVKNCQEPNPDVTSCTVVTNTQSKFEVKSIRRNVPNPEVKELINRPIRDFCYFRQAGQYEHPLFCDVFLYCGVGATKAVPIFCRKGLNYNTILGICDFKKYIQCNFPNTNLITNEGTVVVFPTQSLLVSETCNLKGWGDYPDPASCENYISCSNTQRIIRSCYKGLFFRPTSITEGICDWPSNVNCVDGKRDRQPMIRDVKYNDDY